MNQTSTDRFEEIGKQLIKEELLNALETLRMTLSKEEVIRIAKRIGEKMKQKQNSALT